MKKIIKNMIKKIFLFIIAMCFTFIVEISYSIYEPLYEIKNILFKRKKRRNCDVNY